MLTFNHSFIEAVSFPMADKHQVSVDIKRDDLVHPVVSGNKWRKLQFSLQDAKNKGCDTIVSMGGNWSNHLHALAYAGKELGFKTIAFVRAHHNQPLTPTLEDCRALGMELHFTDRKHYSELRKTQSWAKTSLIKESLGKDPWTEWQHRFPNSYWLAEGGFGELAIKGVMDIGKEITEHYDYVFVGCGSGATLCGLAIALPQSHVVGVGAFSGAEYLVNELSHYLGQLTNWSLDTNHHAGGFAKTTAALTAFQNRLEQDNNFELDQVYNAKTFYALQSWITEGKIKPYSKVLVIHTGGLQGKRLMTDKISQ